MNRAGERKMRTHQPVAPSRSTLPVLSCNTIFWGPLVLSSDPRYFGVRPSVNQAFFVTNKHFSHFQWRRSPLACYRLYTKN